MARLDGRVAIVTAGRGIGRSVAKLLASEGASVVVNDLGAEMDGSGQDAGPAQQVVAEIAEAGGKAVVNGADISDFAAAEGLVAGAIDQFGRLDVLVNVAGILRDRMVFNMTETEWDDVIRVHLKGTFNTTRFASAHWRSLRDETAQNRIINFTSVSGLHGAPGQPNYAAAKMGIVGLTYSSAHSLAKYGVTVNAISPGAATRMTESVPTERAGPAGRGRRRRTLARQRGADRGLPGLGALRAGSPAGSSTRWATRSRCTTTPSRSAGSSAPGRGTIPTRSPTRWSGRSARSWAGTREPGERGAPACPPRARPKAVPVPTPETQPYWDGAAAGELRIQRCLDCGEAYFYPRPLCPSCGSGNVEWFTASGRATLYSYVINHRPAPGFEADAPYAIAVVQLAEGPRMMTNLVGVAPTPEALQLDMELRVAFEQRGEVTLPVFTPG